MWSDHVVAICLVTHASHKLAYNENHAEAVIAYPVVMGQKPKLRRHKVTLQQLFQADPLQLDVGILNLHLHHSGMCA